ncbi:MAG: YqzH family protein [Ectobacillus sp.]
MNEKLLRKMIRNCFYQYQYSEDTIPLSEEEYRQLIAQIKKLQTQQDAALYELIEDTVYEYITK